MQNYHKHSHRSNIFTADSAALNEDYAKRAVELGHKIISSVEHGYAGDAWEVHDLAQKYGLKPVSGAEAYWVLDRHESDRTNCHIVLLAKNEKGRRAINSILSTANEDGYYYRPRVDIELLMSLPEEDIVITTACVAFYGYGMEKSDEAILQLFSKFGSNFFLEIQYHNIPKQIEVNEHIKQLHEEYGIEMIVGLDSHYVYPEQAQEREEVLIAKKTKFAEEDGMILDYPDDKTILRRFEEQGVFTKEQVQKAMDNTDICLTFDDYDRDNPLFDTSIKLPTPIALKGKTKEEIDSIYGRLITKKFKDYMKNVPRERYREYYEGVKMEVNTYKETNMSIYPLIDYMIFSKGRELGGLITNSGRGSSVGYFSNTLCGFSQVDRFKSPVVLFPERFISKSRILDGGSVPDLDVNVDRQEPFEEAQIQVMGPEHAAPLVAFGTLKKKSAFKLYARAQNLDFSIANVISSQIEKFDKAWQHADDEERETLNIYDFVDSKYHSYVTASQTYWGIIMDKKKAPCSYILTDYNVREVFGLIKCKSETTKKEYLVAALDGATVEKFKFLKNDILVISVLSLIHKVFERAGVPIPDVETLKDITKEDESVWGIYARGLTVGINQCEKASTTEKLIRYKPKNISELTAFVAAIRPGFKSLYSKFESRVPFSYGIPSLDNMIQTKDFPYSYVLYQENIMQMLSYAGFPSGETYTILKKISKKKGDQVRKLKGEFLEGFTKALISKDHVSPDSARKTSDEVWTIIEDACSYSYNAAHAYCMALDSLYCAYLKAHYPYEFYEVLLQFYSDKGNKDKVRLIKQEMKAFGISEGPYRFGVDNRKFKSDKDHHQIIPSLLSIKSLSQKCADVMYKLGQQQWPTFLHLYRKSQEEGVNTKQLDILIKIGYFCQFGTQKQLDQMVEMLELLGWEERKSIDIGKVPDKFRSTVRPYVDDKGDFLPLENIDISAIRDQKDAALNAIVTEMKSTYKTKKASLELIKSNADLPAVHRYYDTKRHYDDLIANAQDKLAQSQRERGLQCLLEICESILANPEDYKAAENIQREFNCLGYLANDYSKYNSSYGIVSTIDDKYATRKVTIYRICDGETTVYKVFAKTWEELPLMEGDIIRIKEARQDYRRMKDETGHWVPTKELEWILKGYDVFRKTS